MAARKPSFLLVLAVGLVLALTADRAAAAIIVHDDSAGGLAAASPLPDTGQIGASDEAETGTATPISPPVPPAHPNPGDTPLQPRLAEGALPGSGTAGNAGSASHGGGPGTPTCAFVGNQFRLPRPILVTRVPREASPMLPTGPPFELLRPPRWLQRG